MRIKVGSKVRFSYQHEGHGVHGFGVVEEKIILKPQLVKYTIRDPFGKIHSCINKEVQLL